MTHRGFYDFEGEPEAEPKPKDDLARGGANGQAASTWRDRIKLHCAADLEGRAIPPRQWIVRDWIPSGHITGLYGHGGGGKTTLLTQLLCSASGQNGHWLGMAVRQSRSFGVFCEDDPDEVARKIAAVRDACGHQWVDYRQFGHLNRFGDENLLVRRGRNGLEITEFYADLCELVADERRDLIGFDGITDIYGGNINDPIEVTWFMGRLLGLARPTKATILLLGHPNKAGTSEFLGCGAWENKPRARLYLGPPKKNGDDDEPDLNDPRRVLSRSKANLSGKDALDVIWRDGVFRVADPKLMTMAERCDLRAKEAAAEKAFLEALDQLTEQRRHTSHSCNAMNFAPKVMFEARLVGSLSKKELAEAMERLFSDGTITAAKDLWRGPNRHFVTGIGRTNCAKVAPS